MPELPEVETVRRGLAPAMEGFVIERLELRRTDLRFPFPQGFASAIENRTIIALGRRAKYLLIDLDSGQTIVAHLGMSGSYRVEEDTGETDTLGGFHVLKNGQEKHDHVLFHLRGSHVVRRVIYNDPRRFGFMRLIARTELDQSPGLKSLGREPTGNSLDVHYLAECFAGKKQNLKSALLDQRNIAGLGNIYVCEALWRAALSPFRVAGDLVTPAGHPSDGLTRLVPAIRNIIAEAIAAGGSTLRDHRKTDGTLGYFQHSFSVYGRTSAPCPHPTCNGTIERAAQAGRSTFYCPACQTD